MLRLTNLTTHPMDLDRFTEETELVDDFLKSHDLDGFEVMFLDEWEEQRLSKGNIYGAHMRFWPMWLDFWKGNREGLLKEFLTEAAMAEFYGGDHRNAMVEHYRAELCRAEKNQCAYVVFHVSHVTLEHCYTYDFNYTDEEVAEAFIELMNEVLEDFRGSLTLLFENQWWPGLTFKNPQLMDGLMDRIQYPYKGFMLDIGHFMNTNTDLNTEAEGVDYILSSLKTLGEERVNWIKGIHLNSSLSGRYVKQVLEAPNAYDGNQPFWNRYIEAYGHIGQIDCHKPFEDAHIGRVIDLIQPNYLVYEFITETYAELSSQIKQQQAIFSK